MKRLLSTALVALFLTACASQRQETKVEVQPPIERLVIRKVAVLPPFNQSKEPFAGVLVGGALTESLNLETRYEVVSARESLLLLQTKNLFDDYQKLGKQLGVSAELDPSLFLRFGKALGADAVLIPSVVTFNKYLVKRALSGPKTKGLKEPPAPKDATTVVTIGARLVETATGRILWSSTKSRQQTRAGESPYPDYAEVTRALTRELLSPLKQPLEPTP